MTDDERWEPWYVAAWPRFCRMDYDTWVNAAHMYGGTGGHFSKLAAQHAKVCETEFMIFRDMRAAHGLYAVHGLLGDVARILYTFQEDWWKRTGTRRE